MSLNEVVTRDVALEEVTKLMDARNMLPTRRAKLEDAISTVADAIQFGKLAMNPDGTITQTLFTPVGTTTELTYKSRVTAEDLNKALKMAKTATDRIIIKIKMYTGQLEATLMKLEDTDSEIASCLSLFL